jgi:hypothetical protein
MASSDSPTAAGAGMCKDTTLYETCSSTAAALAATETAAIAIIMSARFETLRYLLQFLAYDVA